MPPGKRNKTAHVARSSNGIDALPDGILEHILGFVPAKDAVKTCVLARRWCNLWKSATALSVSCVGNSNEDPALLKERQKSVDHLLRLRGFLPLEKFEVRFSGLYDDDTFCLIRWIQHAVKCRVQMLILDNVYRDGIDLGSLHLVSQHLTKLELIGIMLHNSFCDFSSCPVLEHLEIDYCYWWTVEKISSESLKHLSLKRCELTREFHILISTPSLVSLRLDCHLPMAPVLVSMPLLKEAFVRVTHWNAYTGEWGDYSGDCSFEDCYSCKGLVGDNDNKCVLLEGLSNAENMALIPESTAFIFGKDLKQCPTFSKLKTLLLDDRWCVAPDFPALTCILEHSPVLEKLTLHLFSKGPKHKVEMLGRYHPTDGSAAVSECLKVVEVKCQVVDEKVQEVLKFLCTFNISAEIVVY
ncbi:F-box/LRR-repeat protein 13-like isoform X1 [Miscanthus floridulus]|uniref:F-box/LRR-repeat protein 13-like isoform X1 n=1 Tax=Miscanthus floridulus TaxID=154761 RepID=UPI003457E4A5